MVITDEIEIIKDMIIKTKKKKKIYLFGSYAKGTPDDDSDYDFYIVIPDGERPVEAIQAVYRSMKGISRKPADILAGTVEIFERRSKQITLERTIAEEGVVLYERGR
jgi:predicted nucleotidyltransferase